MADYAVQAETGTTLYVTAVTVSIGHEPDSLGHFFGGHHGRSVRSALLASRSAVKGSGDHPHAGCQDRQCNAADRESDVLAFRLSLSPIEVDISGDIDNG